MKANSFTIFLAPAIIFATCIQGASAQDQSRLHFELPSTELRVALRIVARKAGLQLIADSSAIRGKRSNPLVGDYTVEEAVAALIEGMGLTFEIKERTILVRPGPAAPNTV
jgi:hypothetical protein